MIASPVSGSRLARRLDKLGWSKLNSLVAYLASPSIDGKDMSAAYKLAADRFIGTGASSTDIPRFHYFVGADDNIVAA